MRTLLIALVLAAGCGGEGSDPADCVDGTDNDHDSLLDCRDPGCESVQACIKLAHDTATPRDGVAAQVIPPPTP